MPDFFKSKGIRTYISLLILLFASVAVFWQALGHDFLINWDDRQYVLDNPTIRGLSIEHLKTAFTSFYIGNYAPLHLVSYMLDYEIWGLRASGFIFTNIFIHSLNGVLFYLALKRMVGDKYWILPAALIFLLHPVQVESVVWVSQRKNVLAMLFFLVSLYSYLVYREEGRLNKRTPYLVSLAAFSLSLLAKSVVVVMPLVLLLCDFTIVKQRDPKRLITDKIPFISLAVVFSLLATQSQTVEYLGGRTSWHGGTPYSTFLTMLPVLLAYLRMVLWPANLSAVYDVPIKTGIDAQVAWAMFACVVAVGLGIFLYRRRPDLLFWFALFFIALIPVSQIVPIVTLMNDRYLYFPMLGASAFLCAAVHACVEGKEITPLRINVAVEIVLLAVGGIFAALSYQRVEIWSNSATLWQDTVRKAPNVALVHDCFGEGLVQQGKIDDAIREFRLALSIEPDPAGSNLSVANRNAVANTRNNLGTAYGIKGMPAEAIEQFRTAIQLNPKLASAYYNLGNALMQNRMVAQALQAFETAVLLEPENAAFVANLQLTRQIMSSLNQQNPTDGKE